MGDWRTPTLPAGLAGGDPSAFVGRRRELESMERVWAAVASGTRQAVFVGGEPGVGKTRLAAEIATTLHGQGATVLWGASYPDLDVPYRPFVTAFEGLLADVAPESLVAPDDAVQLLRLTSHARALVPETEEIPAAGGEAALPLFEAVAGFLEAIATRAPVVLVLEDMHWAGPPTIQMLKHLVRTRLGAPLLVLVTHRSTAPDRSDELSFAIADLYPLGGVTRLDLSGLDVEDIADYLAVESGRPRSDVLAHATVLRDQTAGNPFFLRELWGELSQQGGLAELSTIRAPASVRDTLDRRLAALAAADADVIELAAVAGQRVASADLLAASSHDRASTLGALDVAVAAGILAEDPATVGTYVFRHALVRHAVLDRMGVSHRAELHARLAHALSGRGTDDPDLVARLAHHYEAAQALGYADEARASLVLVARHAERSLAHADAADAYLRAAALATVVSEREELLLAACRTRRASGAFVQARDLAEQVARSADPRTAVRAAVQHEDTSWRPGFDGSRSLGLLEAALARYEAPEDDPLRIRAMASCARALSFVGQDARARTVGERGLELARGTGDDALLAHALACTLWRGMTPALAPQLLARAEELTALARRRGDADRLASAGFYRAVFSYMLGDPEGWSAGVADLESSTSRTGDPFMRYVLVCGRYAGAFARGDVTETRSRLEELGRFTHEFGPASTEGSHGIQTFMLERVTGGLADVRPLITGDEDPADLWAPGLLALYVELGLRAGARRVLPHVLDQLEDPAMSSVQRAGVLAFAVDASVAMDDRDAAARLLPQLQPFQGMNLILGQFVALFGAADRYLGMLESLLGVGDPDGRFEAALALDRRMRATLHQVETLRAWGRHLRRAGTPTATDRAQHVEAEAQALAERFGYGRGTLTTGGDGVIVLPDELTPRELDVLRLVARGLSNREIGGELFISQNTAANHVRNILMKTGAPNRTSAAMYAAEHGLLEDA